jgi:hypothetical protein
VAYSPAMLSRRLLCIVLIAAAFPAVAAAEGPQKKKGGGLTYVQFDTLTATIIRPDGRRGVMTVDVGIDAPDAGVHNKVVLWQPRLRAAFVQWTVSYAASLSAGAPPNPDYIATALQHEVDRSLGVSGAKVLLGAILVN